MSWALLILYYFEQKQLLPFLTFIFFGFILSETNPIPTPLLLQSDQDSDAMILLQENPKSGQYYYSAKALVYDLKSKNELKVLLKADSTLAEFSSGDILCARGKFQMIRAASSPEDFDYSEYMRGKGIFQSFKIQSPYEFIDQHTNLSFQLSRFQRQLAEELPLKQSSKALIAALVLGYKNELNDELKFNFRNSGIMHVLAVSGLHVGLILLLLNLLTKKLLAHPKWKILRFLITITGVWSFALLTGGSTSVLRAALMFSFLALGLVFGRSGSSLNFLGMSGLLLLSLDPDQLFQPGFQLSFAAVGGLIIYQPLHREIKSGIWQKIKDASSTSIIAQLWTSPLILFYFGQVPSYFLLGNLILLPIATILLYSGIALLFLQNVPIISRLNIIVVEFLSDLILNGSSYISSLPHSSFEFPLGSVFTVILCLVMLLVLRQSYYSKSIRSFALFLLFWAISIGLDIKSTIDQKPELTFKKEGFSQVYLSGDGVSIPLPFKDSIFTSVPGVTFFNEERTLLGVKQEQHRLISVQKWGIIDPPETKLETELLLLSGVYPSPENKKNILSSIDARIVMIHPGYYSSLQRKWEKLLEEDNIPVYQLSESWLQISGTAR